MTTCSFSNGFSNGFEICVPAPAPVVSVGGGNIPQPQIVVLTLPRREGVGRSRTYERLTACVSKRVFVRAELIEDPELQAEPLRRGTAAGSVSTLASLSATPGVVPIPVLLTVSLVLSARPRSGVLVHGVIATTARTAAAPHIGLRAASCLVAIVSLRATPGIGKAGSTAGMASLSARPGAAAKAAGRAGAAA